MRSQAEIIRKIHEIKISQVDPLRIQERDLVRKLTWVNAQDYLNEVAKRSEDLRGKWDQSSRLDRKYLLEEMREYMFHAFECVLNEDIRECMKAFFRYIIWVWLLGDKEHAVQREMFRIFEVCNPRNCYREVFEFVCRAYGWKRETFARDWEFEEQKKGLIDVTDHPDEEILS